jgi:hypothetical protein
MEEEQQSQFVISESGISKDLLECLQGAEITKVCLNFSGGSDQGYLDVSAETADGPVPQHDVILTEILNAAWRGFSYSGAGDGSDYGDDYTFDLIKKKIHHSSWFHAPTYTKSKPVKMDVI